MRMRPITHGLLCNLIVCCAVPTMAQSVSNSISAAVDASAGSSVSASVSASVDEVTRSGAASRSGPASRSASINAFAVASSRAELRTSRGERSAPYASTRTLPANRAAVSARKSAISKLPLYEEEQVSGYSPGFADSTKGSGLISPPDSGTESPLDWTPDFKFGFADLSETQFLNPTLHRVAPRRLARTMKTQRSPIVPTPEQKILNESAPPTSIDQQLGLTPEQGIEPAPSASIDQELGLQ
jgi:hypothetical protein